MMVIVVAVIGLLSNPKSNALLAAEEGQLIKGFLENYYGQLAYSEEEQEDIEKEIMELSSIISLNGEIDTPSGEVRPNGFYYFYKETLTPELYSAMVRNRKLPELNMIQIGTLKSEVMDLKLKKEKNIIHASFKVACYGAELPFIVYESKEQLVFYNYMGIFVYDLNHSKMSHAIKLLDQEFTKTQGDKSTIVNYDEKEKILNIYQVGAGYFEVWLYSSLPEAVV